MRFEKLRKNAIFLILRPADVPDRLWTRFSNNVCLSRWPKRNPNNTPCVIICHDNRCFYLLLNRAPHKTGRGDTNGISLDRKLMLMKLFLHMPRNFNGRWRSRCRRIIRLRKKTNRVLLLPPYYYTIVLDFGFTI